MWIKDPNSNLVIEDAFLVTSKSKIKSLKFELDALQAFDQFESFIAQTKATQEELLELLKREECLWRDKARIQWVEDEDLNTRFFHLSTIIRMRYNGINFILVENNTWKQIGVVFVLSSINTTLICFHPPIPTFLLILIIFLLYLLLLRIMNLFLHSLLHKILRILCLI